MRNFVYRTIPAILEKMSTLSIRDLDLRDKRVFMRVDFNVPLAPGGKEITSDKRIKASLPSIQYALDHGAALILASHLGRPKGKPNPEMSLAPCAERLVTFVSSPLRGWAMIGVRPAAAKRITR